MNNTEKIRLKIRFFEEADDIKKLIGERFGAIINNLTMARHFIQSHIKYEPEPAAIYTLLAIG